MAVPVVPAELRAALEKQGLGLLYRFIAQDQHQWLVSRFDTQGDATLLTPGKGTVCTNAAGTITKRIRLNDAGNGIIIEDV